MDVLLLTDVDGWAWDIKAKELKKNLPYNIEIKKMKDFNSNDLLSFNSIHSFSWMIGSSHSKITAGISSHNYRILHSQNSYNTIKKFLAISCVSQELFELAKKEKINKNIYPCFNGVNENKFYPNEKKQNNKFVVGWVGQKTSGYLDKKPYDIKGFESILMPIVKKMSEHNDIEFLIHSNNYTNAISHDEMPRVYKNIDLLISTSLFEGTPGSVFEAASSGLPIVSTSVGCVPLLIKDNYNGFLIPRYNKNNVEQTINSFIEKILILKNNRELGTKMGKYNRLEIEKNWTWKVRAKQWIPIFENHRVR